ncbi:MAG: foldase protein PrsA [Thermoanaerobaculaceae bacterium]
MDKKLLATFAVVVSACCGGEKPLARVAGKAITWNDLKRAVEQIAGRPVSEVNAELVGQIFADLLQEEVVLAASPNPEDRNLSQPLRSKRVRELLSQLCPPPPPPSPQEVSEELARQKPEDLKERLYLRQLILSTQSQAEAARARLLKGESFEALSRELSRAPNAQSGGVLGWIERGQLPPEFEAAVADLHAGQFSLPVESPAGWHVFYVEKKEKGLDPNTRRRIEEALRAAREESARKQCLAALARGLEVQVNCPGVPFPCENPFVEVP